MPHTCCKPVAVDLYSRSVLKYGARRWLCTLHLPCTGANGKTHPGRRDQSETTCVLLTNVPCVQCPALVRGAAMVA